MAAAEKRKHYYWRHDTQDVTCHSYLLALRVCVSVCVCVCSSHLFWVAVPPIKARRGYTLQCIWRGLHVFSVLFCLTRTNRVVQEGVNTRRALFFFSFSFCAAPSSCGSAFILFREGFFSRPYPSSTESRILCTSRQLFQLFCRLPLTYRAGTEVRKKKNFVENL